MTLTIIDFMTGVYEDYCKKQQLPLLDVSDLLYGRDTKETLTLNLPKSK